MRVQVKCKAPREKPAPGAAPKPRRTRETPPCIGLTGAPCPDPLGGLIRAGRKTPMRIDGRCSACFQRRRRLLKAVADGRKILPCRDPECKAPLGGPIPKGGTRPERIHEYCRTCWDRRISRWKRDKVRKAKAG